MKVDRRVWHTRRLLQDSLLEILNDKRLEDVSVKEICDRAGVNRSTFYSYFNGTRELLASLKKDMIDEIRLRRVELSGDLPDCIRQICGVLWEYRKLLKLLVENGELSLSMAEIMELWKDDFRRVLSGWTADPLFVAAGCRYLTCGAGSVILMWTLGDLPLNREELVSRLCGMMAGGLDRPYPLGGFSGQKTICCEKFT